MPQQQNLKKICSMISHNQNLSANQSAVLVASLTSATKAAEFLMIFKIRKPQHQFKAYHHHKQIHVNTVSLVLFCTVIPKHCTWYCTIKWNRDPILVSDQMTLLFHLLLSFKLSVVGNIADYLGGVADAQGFWVICNLSELALSLLKVFMVFHLKEEIVITDVKFDKQQVCTCNLIGCNRIAIKIDL